MLVICYLGCFGLEVTEHLTQISLNRSYFPASITGSLEVGWAPDWFIQWLSSVFGDQGSLDCLFTFSNAKAHSSWGRWWLLKVTRSLFLWLCLTSNEYFPSTPAHIPLVCGSRVSTLASLLLHRGGGWKELPPQCLLDISPNKSQPSLLQVWRQWRNRPRFQIRDQYWLDCWLGWIEECNLDL